MSMGHFFCWMGLWPMAHPPQSLIHLWLPNLAEQSVVVDPLRSMLFLVTWIVMWERGEGEWFCHRWWQVWDQKATITHTQPDSNRWWWFVSSIHSVVIECAEYNYKSIWMINFNIVKILPALHILTAVISIQCTWVAKWIKMKKTCYTANIHPFHYYDIDIFHSLTNGKGHIWISWICHRRLIYMSYTNILCWIKNKHYTIFIVCWVLLLTRHLLCMCMYCG